MGGNTAQAICLKGICCPLGMRIIPRSSQNRHSKRSNPDRVFINTDRTLQTSAACQAFGRSRQTDSASWITRTKKWVIAEYRSQFIFRLLNATVSLRIKYGIRNRHRIRMPLLSRTRLQAMRIVMQQPPRKSRRSFLLCSGSEWQSGHRG